MKRIFKNTLFLVIVISSSLACTTTPQLNNVSSPSHKKIFIYEDGRMVYRERLLSHDDVLFYSDGYGGEHAAIKMRTAIHPDYYLAPIKVVRLQDEHEE